FLDLRIKRVRHLVAAFLGRITGLVARVCLNEKRIEIEIVEPLSSAADLKQEVSSADDLIKSSEAERREDLAHFLCDEAEEMDHLLRRTGKLRAELLVLCADADRAGVRVALADHDAAHSHKCCRADAELFRAHHRGHHHVAAGTNPAICAKRNAM